MFFFKVFVICSVLILNMLAYAGEITVRGNKTIEAKTVKTYSELEGKEPITKRDISNAIKKIYKTGFFSNVSISQNGKENIINVTETPVVKKIEFNGSKAIGKDKMIEELSTKEKRFFSKIDIQNDAKRLTLIYQKLGFLNAKVRPMAELSKDGTQVVVIFDIKEGKKAQIDSISIEGNKNFSDRVIKDEALKIRERTIWKFNLGASFDEERVQNEAENIKLFYMHKGFPKFEIKNVVSKYNTEDNLFDIIYYIKEGDRYKFGEYEIRSYVSGFDIKNIKIKDIVTKKNAIFNINHVEQTVVNIQDILQERGFMFSKVDYEFEYTEDKRVNVKYIINNSKRMYLNSIEITGNVKTSDAVIRREFLLKEGDVYNVVKLRRSIQRLNNLQYFDDIQVDEKITEGTTDRMNLKINVKERSTANVSASIGFDQLNGLGGNIGVQQSNFMGEGYAAGFSAERTFVSEGYNLSFTDPYFKGRNFLFGVNLSYSKYGNPDFLAYDSKTSSITFTGAYSITEYLRHSIVYRYQTDNITTNSSSSVSPFILAQIGSYKTSALSSTLMYDRRDNNFIPNEGYSLMLRNEIAGLGGNVKFLSGELKADWYKKLFNLDELVFSSKLRLARIQSFGGSITNIQNLYALGGGFGMRGFNYRGLGPRLAILDDSGNISSYESFSYGGKNLETMSFELRFPNKLPKDIGLITYLFFDVGRLYGIDGNNLNTTTSQILDSKAFRVSTGLGISWRSPMGPIGFAFGRALRQEVYDNSLFFLITFGGLGQF